MSLEEIRGRIDLIDTELQELLMRRMDCSLEVARAKRDAGDTVIYRPDREEAILRRLGNDVPAERRAAYLAVVRKIMESSRMYQYSLFYDWNESLFLPLVKGLPFTKKSSLIHVVLTRPDRPNSMSSILSMIGDYGLDMCSMELLSERHKEGTVTFALCIRGDIRETGVKKLLYQLSRECENFQITKLEK